MTLAEEPTVLARAGFKALREMQRVLETEKLPSQIVCPPGGDPNA